MFACFNFLLITSDTHLYVSNNNLTDPEVYPYFLGTRFAMGYRAKRASQLIDKELVNGTKITMDYLKSVQIDVHDLASEELVKNVLKNFDLEKAIKDHDIQIPEWLQVTRNSVIPKVVRDNVEVKVDYYNDPVNREKAEYAWKILSEWDFKYTLESLGCAIYDSFLDILIRRLIIGGIYGAISKRNPSKVDPDTDDDEKKEEEENILTDAERLKIAEKLSDNIMRNVYNRIFCGLTAFFYKRIGPVLTMFCSENSKKECWWIQNYGNRENLFIMSLIDAIDCIQFWSKTKDRSQWKWGSLHQIEVAHPLSVKLGPKPFNSVNYPVMGGHHCLNMNRPNFESIVENPLKVTKSGTSVWRHVIDCSDWTTAKCILPMGTSGQVSSPYYQNQLKKWADCEYIPMLWNKDDVEENKASELVCDPLKNLNDDDKSSCVIL